MTGSYFQTDTIKENKEIKGFHSTSPVTVRTILLQVSVSVTHCSNIMSHHNRVILDPVRTRFLHAQNTTVVSLFLVPSHCEAHSDQRKTNGQTNSLIFITAVGSPGEFQLAVCETCSRTCAEPVDPVHV